MWQGIIDLAAGQLAAAVEDLDHANGLDPSNVDILYQRGHAALVLSRQSYEAMFKADPHSWHVAQVLAEADVEQGNDADAIEQFKAAIATAPPQSGLYEGLGSAYWRTGKYPEAQQAYEEAVKIDPADIVSVYKLGCLRVDRGDAAGGKPLLEKALATDSSLSLASYYLGRAEIQLGNDQAAIAHFEQTIHENLDDDTTKQAYFQLSRVYRRMHNQAASDEAQAQYRILEDKGRQVLQEKLNRRLMRGDRDVTIPSPPADKSSTQPSPTQPQKQE
jgi:tetratricopeptide (TPR) repeat protein